MEVGVAGAAEAAKLAELRERAERAQLRIAVTGRSGELEEEEQELVVIELYPKWGWTERLVWGWVGTDWATVTQRALDDWQLVEVWLAGK